MTFAHVKRVGIIGAGVAGLSTAKTLLAQGLHCTVFERGAELGGVWTVGYSNFGTQVQKELYEFPDFPLPKDVPELPPGPVVQKYLEDYARHFGVLPHIQFNTRVVEIRERSGETEGWTVTYEQGGERRQAEFDLIAICTGLYSNTPNRPQFPHQERFRGKIIHISELTTRGQLEGKKVAVVGFGKSATDAAVESAAVAKQTTIIFRKPHWPVPPKLLGVLPFKWAMLGRLTHTLIPPYYRPSGLERVLHTVGKPLVWLWWRLVELLLIAQCGLGSRFGTRPSLIPKIPVEIDAFGESVMLPRPEFYRGVRRDAIRPQQTEIAQYTENGVVLKNGQTLEVDVVVLATGWNTDYSFLWETVRHRLNIEDDGFYLYRHIVHPGIPNLVFIGCTSSITNPLTYNLQARWLGELIKGHHRLPAHADMNRHIEEVKAWKRKWMPFSSARGSRLLLHMLHYHDELLRDMGAEPLRKTGVFAPFKEVFAPYQPSDYRDIVSVESQVVETTR